MRSPLRLGLFYAALYLGVGVSTPYASVWFRERGLSGGEIGVVLAAPQLARTVTGPALAVWSDGLRLRRTGLALVCAGAAMAYAALFAVSGFWLWLAVWFAASSLITAAPPLVDVITLRRAARDAFDYGRVRSFGSAAFIVADVAGGLLLQALGAWIVIAWTALAATCAAVVARALTPPEPVNAAGSAVTIGDRLRGMGRLLGHRRFALAVLSSGLIQATHGFYYGFSTLIWRSQGLGAGVIGVLWGFGVATEVAFLLFMAAWRRRLGAERLLILGGLAAVVRWAALAASPPLVWLFPLQALHGLTFAATFVASLQLAERFSPPERATSAQMLNSALSGGLLIGLATLGSGELFDRFGAKGYFAMAAMAGVGLVGAAHLYRISPTRRSGPVR